MKVSAADKAVAIVGVGAIMPDAPNAPRFWQNIKDGLYSITDVPADRWDPAFYYDPDLKAPDKSYTKIGGWVQEWDWDPLKWRLPIPPKVSMAMDLTQKWGVATAREALNDYGYPKRPLNPERVAVILGNAMGGDTHLYSAARVFMPEFVDKLVRSKVYGSMSDDMRREVLGQLQEGFYSRVLPISEDTMPGELSNILAGRIAALYDFKGPNYTADAACASAMAAISAAVVGLTEHDYDAVLTGGIDANMSPSTFVKFCKLGALSATGSRPYAEGSDGFVMGEGGAVILLKRLVDAERDGDKIYAVIRGLGGSSDGKGKGITAPNPIGQALCVRRAWEKAGITPEVGDLIEGHGTSTPVGDAGELESLSKFFNDFDLPVGSIALGSVKSNIGHLKGAAGAAGILKAAFALYDKALPPSLNFKKPNPIIDFQKVPFKVNTELRPWDVPDGKARRAAVSAFGFGGTNFHMVMEEYIPGRIAGESKTVVSVPEGIRGAEPGSDLKSPLRGAAVLGADSEAELIRKLQKLQKDAGAGNMPDPAPPYETDLRARFRLAIDYGDAAELADKAERALKACEENQPGRWKALRAKGIFRGEGPAQKVAFLFTGQGSQYVNMLKTLRETEPIVTRVFEEADRTMEPLLGKPLTDCIYLDKSDEAALKEAEDNLKQTAITQPAVLATENAIARMLGAYGITPDMVMGHSLGEYGALVAAGAMSFKEALKAVSARGKEMTRCALEDNGMMAAAFGPIEKIQEILETVDDYVVIANINSSKEAVIGGTTTGVKKAMDAIDKAGYTVRALQVSHAFHTRIVAPAGESLAQILSKMDLCPPEIPIVTNVTGGFYPMGPAVVPEMIKLLGKQVSSPVQFIKGLNTLYDAGARIFVEIGPKRILYGFVEDALGSRDGVVSLFTNHPRIGEAASLNLALCGLYAAGLGFGAAEKETAAVAPAVSPPIAPVVQTAATAAVIPEPASPKPAFETGGMKESPRPAATGSGSDKYTELGRLFAEFMDRGLQIYSGGGVSQAAAAAPVDVCITGASLGLPGTEKVFDDSNIERILRGDGFIRQIPTELRQQMADKNITRIVKTAGGEGRFETINSTADVIKLAARAGDFDIKNEFGFPEDRIAALDRVTKLAIGAGIDALRDAGVPLVMRYKTTTKGTKLPDRWMLPDEIRDDTGILFTSAFPGCDSFAEIIEGYYHDQIRRQRLQELENIYALVGKNGGDAAIAEELKQRIESLKTEVEENAYQFDRRFLFRVLSMGHSQFAEYIGARGPNTSSNGACSSGTQALGLAQDWIRTGRCKRVIIISADDITSNNLMGWFGSGFLASGSAATDEIVEDAATPFDRRRHGLIIGMGASAVVLESRESAKARGIRPICNVLGSVVANSAFHGTRLDVSHICHVMEKLISEAEARWGIDRYQIAPETVFVSHETYTPARGGSASAEVFALRHVFKEAADRILVANTKGATGHPMAVGIEDVVSVKILETGIVPPVANFKEVDPELGMLNLSKGGSHQVRYALRLGAGFGSQISMSLMRWEPTPDGNRQPPSALGYRYRIEDPEAWSNWLKHLTGYENPELEIVQRTLRAKDQGPTVRIENGTTTFSALQASNGPAPAPAAPVAASSVSGTSTTPAFGASPASAGDAATRPAPAMTVAPAKNPVQEEVMNIIAEKTGYPPDMLDLDLDLEADLGIDTVKQAEMFAAIRESYNIPREDNLKLRDFPTLSHVLQFVYDRRPDLAPAAPVAQASVSGQSSIPAFDASPAAAGDASAPAATAVDAVQQEVMNIIAEKTGYPPDMLDPDLDLEADLGIDTVKQAEMFAAIRESYNIPREDNLKLRDFPTLQHVIQFVYDRRPDLVPAAPVAQAPAPAAAASVSGQSSTPAFDASTALAVDAASAAAVVDGVQQDVLKIIAEKTGYPPDMLDPDLDLEADLGIDTVKQAEMFAAIRELYNIPREDNLKMRDFPTLTHVIQFVYDRRPDLAPAALAVAASVSGQSSTPASDASPAKAVDAATPVAAGATAAVDGVQQEVLKIIAEKTGYPPDMLDPDLDLEADLGIDTVKQAEMFAAIRELYNIPREDNLKMRDFPTLTHVIQFVYDRRPDLAPGAATSVSETTTAPASEASPAVASEAAAKPVTGSLEAANAVPRRVPVPKLRPALDFCKATGVELKEGTQVVLMPDQGGIGKSLAAKLEKMGVEPLIIEGSPDAESLLKRIEDWKSEGSIKGVFWLPALDARGDIAGMDRDQWREACRIRVKLLYATMRALYDQVGQAGTFLVSGTRLGGQHGYDESGAVDALGGMVTGFTKAFKRERSEATVKVVDFEPSRKTSALADILIEETLRDPGAVEIGYKDGMRWTVGLKEQPAAGEGSGLTLNKETVFLVTGAAGSIVSAITRDLAAASGGIFYLLDLTPEPDPGNQDLARIETDKENLKRDLFERLKADGKRVTPVMVEKEIASLERSKAALDAIQAVTGAGGVVHYHSLDLTDTEAVASVVKDIADRYGRIDVLMHAAGLEISHGLPDKKPSEFDLVFDVKSDGWYNLVSGIGDMPLGAAVVFSSVAGRFGNSGQTDYSAANDLLCKCISNFRNTGSQTKGIAIDWTAWGGIGMAARGSIPTIMKQAGIEMLPPEAGIPVVRRELTSGMSGEVVIGKKLGILVEEFDPQGGLETGKGEALDAFLINRGIMTGEITSMGLYGGLTVETTLDPTVQPFLYDHQINGTPVLPGVMGVEAMAEAANLLFPERFVGAVENVEFFSPFKFYRNQPRTVVVRADFHAENGDIVADCQLIGSRTLHGQTEPEVTTHFTGRVRLVSEKPEPVREEPVAENTGSAKVESSHVYSLFFHGPAYQVVDSAWQAGDSVVGLFAKTLPPNHEPAELPTIVSPRSIELCFQTVSLSILALQERLGLPYSFREISFASSPGKGAGKIFYSVVSSNPDGSYEAKLVDDKGNVYLTLHEYRIMELPDPVQPDLLKPLKEAFKA
jgi:acyl transferase domain-containing protein/acyl carrier protein/NAD(P)-dependent dehydrogenase (short-subunit alcohol dehydrogenase family)